MTLDADIQGFGLSLRPVVEEDAELVLSLRLDPELGRFLGDTPPDPAAQRAFIRRQRAAPGDGYFVVCTAAGRPVGTIGLYGIEGGAAEWGRWVVAPRVPAAVGSALLLYRLAFERLELDRVCCRTVADNRSVVSFHDSCGLERAALLPGAVVLRGRPHDLVEHQLSRGGWPAVRARLTPLAERVAPLLS